MFRFLKKFVVKSPPKGRPYDFFVPVPIAAIEEAERSLRTRFPPQLRYFYEHVGYGNHVGRLAKEKYGALLSNEILHPLKVVEVRKGLGAYPPPFRLRRGELPFFRMMEDKYLTVNPTSSTPEAIWRRQDDILIASDLETFMRQLLDEPEFVDFAITAEYARRDRQAASRKAAKRKKRVVRKPGKSGVG